MEMNRESEFWLEQFKEADKAVAAELLKKFKFVSGGDFSADLSHLLDTKLPAKEKCALFVERELPSVKGGEPIQMYKEIEIFRGNGLPKRLRAMGAALPVVSSPRNDKQDIGSEGTVATLVSGFARRARSRFVVHPSANEARKSKIRHIVVVTDFLGSGKRVSRMLSSLWKVRSVKSWSSSKLVKVKFWVFAYSATSLGKKCVQKHRTSPNVHIVSSCPTIFNMFSGEMTESVRGLCEDYAPKNTDGLGYGGAGALIAFAHSCPNNAPAIFHKGSMALFPSRDTYEFSIAMSELAQLDPILLALDSLGVKIYANAPAFIKSSNQQKQMIIFLAAIRKKHRHVESLSAVTGMHLREIAAAESCALKNRLIDGNRRLTSAAFSLLRKLNVSGTSSSPAPSQIKKQCYYPSSLRVPK